MPYSDGRFTSFFLRFLKEGMLVVDGFFFFPFAGGESLSVFLFPFLIVLPVW